MMTPQEFSSHAFSKATLGGYNMAMVDEFLDLLTEDYTALYNDNAILKNKLKVLSDTVEEYRATDDAMRKTLLAAQKMADAMVKDAEAKKESLVHDAEAAAKQRVEELKAVGLTVPETTQLLWELRQEGLNVPLDALSDEECAQALYQLLKA